MDSVHIAGIVSGENVQNTFAPFTAWDYDTPIWLDSSADFNVFIGRWDGTVHDSSALNTYITGGQSAFTQPGAYISDNATDSFIATTDLATQQKAMHLRNAGGNLYIGVDNDTGSAFGDPYGSVWYSPKNNSYFVSPMSSFTGTVHQVLTVSDTGSACIEGELSLSSGWGESASVSSVIGTGQTCQWTITAKGTTSTNPTVTDTLTNVLPSPSTVCDMHMVGGTGSATLIQETTFSATAPVFTFNGTPSAGSTYVIVRRCGP